MAEAPPRCRPDAAEESPHTGAMRAVLVALTAALAVRAQCPQGPVTARVRDVDAWEGRGVVGPLVSAEFDCGIRQLAYQVGIAVCSRAQSVAESEAR